MESNINQNLLFYLNSFLEKDTNIIRIHFMYSVFCKLLKILNNYKIIYWLDGGTLLGCCRDNKIIPWDKDMDICIPITEAANFYKLKKLLK